MYEKTRSEGFGDEVKRRIMLGTFVLSSGFYDAYYKRAKQMQQKIAQEYAQAFSQCDVILTPTAPTTAFQIGERTDDPLKMYAADICTVTVNIAGLPAISVPCGIAANGLPIGLQMIGPKFSEQMLFDTAGCFESLCGGFGVAPSVKAVSYTHLDVYKRQTELFPKPPAVIINQAAFSFDLSVADLWPAFAWGAEEYVICRQTQKNYPLLFSRLEHSLSLIHIYYFSQFRSVGSNKIGVIFHKLLTGSKTPQNPAGLHTAVLGRLHIYPGIAYIQRILQSNSGYAKDLPYTGGIRLFGNSLFWPHRSGEMNLREIVSYNIRCDIVRLIRNYRCLLYTSRCV